VQVVAMAENLLSDAKLRGATKAADGPYLKDGGGLRIRLLDPSSKHPRGARIAQYDFKLKRPDGTLVSGSIYPGTIGEPFTDPQGRLRDFTLADARRARDAARDQVSKGIDPRETERLAKLEAREAQRARIVELETRRTVRDAFAKWDRLYLQAKRADGGYLNRRDGGAEVRDLFTRHVLPRLGDLPLEALRRRDVTETLDILVAAGKRRTANMTLALLRQFTGWCAVRDWIDRDPTIGLDKAKVGGEEPPRARNLSELEVIELRDKMAAAKLPERIQEALWLLLATGVRVGELSGAPFSEFDLEAGEWHIPGSRTKNGDPHLVHLSPYALERVKRLQALAKGSAWLLPGRDGTAPVSPKLVSKLVNDRQRETPLKGRSKAAATLALAGGKWVPHDLRRTMATRMGDLSVRPDVIERCLNHRPEGLVATYQRAALLPERRAAFDTWGAKLEALMVADASNVTPLPVRSRRAA
jgi:integrase